MLAMLAEIVWDKQTLTMVGVFAVPIVGCISYAWFQAIRVQSDNALKRSMIERGMSADEIERVLEASRRED